MGHLNYRYGPHYGDGSSTYHGASLLFNNFSDQNFVRATNSSGFLKSKAYENSFKNSKNFGPNVSVSVMCIRYKKQNGIHLSKLIRKK